jgi:ABC-type multidrug transport system ATPase subunit
MEAVETIIEVKNLCKYFKSKSGIHKAVDNISFRIEKGKVVGFVGPNGAGKTTTIKMLVGLVRPTSGEIKIKGKDISSVDIKALIGYVPEKPVLYSNMLPLDYLVYVAELSGVERERAKQLAAYYLELFGLKDAMDKKIGGFSSGMKQKLLIAQALLHDPEVLILDEPTTALDPLGQDQLLNILKFLSKNKGITILISSHHLEELERIADHIIVIQKGKITIDSNVEALKGSQASMLELKVNDLNKAYSVLASKFRFANINVVENKIVISAVGLENIKKDIIQAIIEAGIELLSFEMKTKSLWDAIINILKQEEK